MQSTAVEVSPLLDPVAHLPAEIVAFIFVLSVPNDLGYVHRIGHPDVDEAPLLLTQVSRSWRNFAHGTPRLWNQLRLYGIHCYDPMVEHPKFIDEWLQRSKNLPIDLFIASHIYVDGDHLPHKHERRSELNQVIPVLDAIAPHAHRCQHLFVRLNFSVYETSAWREVRKRLTALRYAELDMELTATGVGVQLDGGRVTCKILPDELPLLTSLRVTSTGAMTFIRNLPWSQLTKLEMSFERRQLFQDIIAVSNSLKNLHITFIARSAEEWFNSGGPDTYPTPIVLPKLSRLSFMTSEYQITEDVLVHTPLPQFKSLRLHFVSEVQADLITDAIRRCRITDLDLASTILRPEVITRLVAKNPQLEKLEVDLHCADDDFLRSLTVGIHGTTTIIAPNLTHLCIDSHGLMGRYDIFEGKSLVDMIRSRVSYTKEEAREGRAGIGHAYLKMIEIGLPWELDATTLAGLEELRSSGIQIHVTSYPDFEEFLSGSESTWESESSSDSDS